MAFLNDGFSTTFAFDQAPNILFKEKTVTPPGYEGGGPNDTTTMRNIRWRTRQPKKLFTLASSTLTASYDPAVFITILEMLNVNQLLTVHFPDGSALEFWGWLDAFKPNEHREGEQPTAEVTIEPSNQDNDGIEIDPVFREAA